MEDFRRMRYNVAMDHDAFRFLQEAAGKPAWTSTITDGGPDEIVALAQENGYRFEMEDLKKVAREIIKGSDDPKDVSGQDIEEASAASVGFDKQGGYGSDSGFVLMSGIAASVLKK